MRSNAIKKHNHDMSAPKLVFKTKPNITLVASSEAQHKPEMQSVDYEAFLLQYGMRSDFA